MKMLTVFAKEDVMVQDYMAMQNGIKRFIGYKYDSTAGGWVLLDETVQIPDIAEYRAEISLGHLVQI
jgi:hypothetical protein